MGLQVKKTEVWVGDLRDVPGGLADVLGTLADARASLEFLIARRDPSRPGQGQVFLTPLKGKRAQGAAAVSGLLRAGTIPTLRVEGPDRAGVGYRMARAIADEGMNVRGFSAAVIGAKFVAYLGFDNEQDADRAARALKKLDGAATSRRPARRATRAHRT